MTAISKEPPAAGLALFNTKLEQLVPSPRNPRRHNDAKAIAELAQSLKDVGVLEPILARPTDDGMLEILAGHRRHAAAKIAGLQTVPVIVKQVDDRVALEIMITENLQRENLHPVDEAAALVELEKAGWSVTEISKHLGKSPAWIGARKCLARLSKKWRDAIEDESLAVRGWSAGCLEAIARLEPSAQDELYEDIEYDLEQPMTLDNLIAEMSRYTHSLAGVPWDVADDSLLPKAGSCLACDKRTACRPDMFGIEKVDGKVDPRQAIPKGDKCLDTECFEKKQHAGVKRAVAQAREKNPGLVVLTNGSLAARDLDGEPYPADHDAGDFVKCAKGDKGAVPTYLIDTGKVEWQRPLKQGEKSQVKPSSTTSGTTRKNATQIAKPKSLRVRITEFQQRRQAWMCTEFRDKILKQKPPRLPELHELINWVAVFGTIKKANTPGAYYAGKSTARVIKELEEFSGTGPGADTKLREHFWKQLVGVFQERLVFYTNKDVPWKEVRLIGEFMGNDGQALERAAAAAIPTPKTLQKALEGGKTTIGVDEAPLPKAVRKADLMTELRNDSLKAAGKYNPDKILPKPAAAANRKSDLMGGPLNLDEYLKYIGMPSPIGTDEANAKYFKLYAPWTKLVKGRDYMGLNRSGHRVMITIDSVDKQHVEISVNNFNLKSGLVAGMTRQEFDADYRISAIVPTTGKPAALEQLKRDAERDQAYMIEWTNRKLHDGHLGNDKAPAKKKGGK